MTSPAQASKSGAVFSADRVFRYRLWRKLDGGKGAICFVMLNPSTADETKNDPTVERCQRRALSMGFSRLDVVNIFALRSTSPRVLYNHDDPIGIANDSCILQAAVEADMLVLAWGSHGRLGERGKRVIEMLRGYRPHVLGMTGNGQPKHPLYISYDQKPVLLSETLSR